MQLYIKEILSKDT